MNYSVSFMSVGQKLFKVTWLNNPIILEVGKEKGEMRNSEDTFLVK